MKKVILIVYILLGVLRQADAQSGDEVLTNKSIIDLQKAGFGKTLLLSKIEESNCKFDVSTTALTGLKKLGVPEDVITAMIKKGSKKKPVTSENTLTDNISKTTVASKTATPPELDFMNVPHFFDKKNNVVKPLERSTVAVKAKVNLLKAMVPGASTPIVFKMDSAHSSVKISSEDEQSFMVNTGMNVPEIFGLYRMTSLKNKREATWFNVSAFENKSDKDVITFNYRKIREGVYEIVPANKMEPGEYCFVNKTSYTTYGGAKADVFAFSIN